jgi:hypothetical protein
MDDLLVEETPPLRNVQSISCPVLPDAHDDAGEEALRVRWARFLNRGGMREKDSLH